MIKVVEPVIAALASITEAEIAAFQNILSKRPKALDGRAWARQSGGMIWWGEPASLSVEGFLYARCAVVANGRAFFETVFQHPDRMPKDMEFESLLYVADRAWKLRTGDEPYDELDHNEVSFETFSNEAGWH